MIASPHPAPRAFPLLPGQTLQVGRSDAVRGIRIMSQFVFRFHGEIRRDADAAFFRSVNSSAGLVLNGERIRVHELQVWHSFRLWDSLEFGDNPLRLADPDAIDPAWLEWNNGCVVELARRIEAEQDWQSFPILADALEDSGCNIDPLLVQCRSRKRKQESCWILDLILHPNGATDPCDV